MCDCWTNYAHRGVTINELSTLALLVTKLCSATSIDTVARPVIPLFSFVLQVHFSPLAFICHSESDVQGLGLDIRGHFP